VADGCRLALVFTEDWEGAAMNDNPHIGESFESFLRDEGICEEVTAEAIKRTLVIQIEQEVVANNISKSEMARRMKSNP
jgi:hypothetical protein